MNTHNILTLERHRGHWDYAPIVADITSGVYDGVVTDFILPSSSVGQLAGYEGVLEDLAGLVDEDSLRYLREGKGPIDEVLSERLRAASDQYHAAMESVRGNYHSSRARYRYRMVGRIQEKGIRETNEGIRRRHACTGSSYAYGVLIAEAAKEARIPFTLVRSEPLNEFSLEQFIDYVGALDVLCERGVMRERDLGYVVSGNTPEERSRHAQRQIEKKVGLWKEKGWGKWRR